MLNGILDQAAHLNEIAVLASSEHMSKYGYSVDISTSNGTVFEHWHSCFEILMAIDTPIVVRQGEVVNVLVPGEWILFDDSHLHVVQACTKAFTGLNCHIMPEMINADEAQAIRSNTGQIRWSPSSQEFVARMMCRIRKWQDGCKRYNTEDELEMRAVLSDLYRERPNRRHIHPIVDEAIHYMLAHPYQEVGIETLAHDLYISPGHLHYLFRTYLGCSPARLWQCIVIERLCKNITKAEENTNELAGRAGFDSAWGLQRAFRRFKNMPVTAYRAGASPKNSLLFLEIPSYLVVFGLSYAIRLSCDTDLSFGGRLRYPPNE